MTDTGTNDFIPPAPCAFPEKSRRKLLVKRTCNVVISRATTYSEEVNHSLVIHSGENLHQQSQPIMIQS